MAVLNLYSSTFFTPRGYKRITLLLNCFGKVQDSPSQSAIQRALWWFFIYHMFLKFSVLVSSPDFTRIKATLSKDITDGFGILPDNSEIKGFVSNVSDWAKYGTSILSIFWNYFMSKLLQFLQVFSRQAHHYKIRNCYICKKPAVNFPKSAFPEEGLWDAAEKRDCVSLRYCRNSNVITEYLVESFGFKTKDNSKSAEKISVNGYNQLIWSRKNSEYPSLCNIRFRLTRWLREQSFGGVKSNDKYSIKSDRRSQKMRCPGRRPCGFSSEWRNQVGYCVNNI